MENLVAYLPLLACPVGMGLMMWLMMRGNPNQQVSGGRASMEMPAGNGAATPSLVSDSGNRLARLSVKLGGVEAQPVATATPTSRLPAQRRPAELDDCAQRNRMGGICFNWRVVAGLAVAGLGVWVVAPNLVWTALPLLLLAACPLSMLLMMRGMQHGRCASQPQQLSQAGGVELTRDEQLVALKAELALARAQQEAIAHKIAALEAASPRPLREAEEVARAADERGQVRPQ